MSFQGEITAKCPKGCEPFEVRIWSFIRGDRDEVLREAVMAKECNLLLCPSCDVPFFPQEPYVYFEPRAEILAFVMPESYRDKEERWRKKMREDFLAMKEAMGSEFSLDLEPEVFFGPDGLAEVLEGENYRGEEREVMECFAKELDLALYEVSPSYARRRRIPSALPYRRADGSGITCQVLLEGLKRVVEANDSLSSYKELLEHLKSHPQEPLPPASTVKSL
ncbi:MAG: hypothetical protein HY921_09060 [Elusimicrobia bacterium]|nr:hypothetical protein [Elusimicrobiota bacterium]